MSQASMRPGVSGFETVSPQDESTQWTEVSAPIRRLLRAAVEPNQPHLRVPTRGIGGLSKGPSRAVKTGDSAFPARSFRIFRRNCANRDGAATHICPAVERCQFALT